MSRYKALLAALAALMLTAFVVTGCGGSDDDSGSGDNGNTSSSTDSGGSGVEFAQEQVDKLKDPTQVEFPKPTEAFDPGKGKIAVISCGNAGINCKDGSEDATDAVKAMGWESSPVFDGEFDPAKQAGFIRQAIQEKYDGIVLVSMDVNSVKAAVDAAVKAKIPVSCVMCSNDGLEDIVTDVTTGGTADGEAIGYWTVADSDGSAKIIGFDDKSFPIVAKRLASAKAVIEENCEDCTLQEEQISTTELTEPGPPTWTATLTANPAGTFDYAWSAYDPFAIPFVKTAEQQGRDDIKISGYDASPDFVELIKQGGAAAATTAAPFEYAAWGAVDEVARMATGNETWDGTKLPVMLVTEDNADDPALKAGFFDPPFDYKAEFAELWGQS
ncbi:MAG: substrate-binding domain-containing protein [Actinomycetota bacterium]|nr:substrate-binding domain-containing protein [Actinomycetota bacterium]